MPGPERKVQWEFKVIVQVDEWRWPHEVGDDIKSAIKADAGYEVVSVEQILDYT